MNGATITHSCNELVSSAATLTWDPKYSCVREGSDQCSGLSFRIDNEIDTNKYAGGMQDRMLKNKMTNELSLKLSPYTTGPKTPAENLEGVVRNAKTEGTRDDRTIRR